jgi:hypothetical protein
MNFVLMQVGIYMYVRMYVCIYVYIVEYIASLMSETKFHTYKERQAKL